MGNYNNLGGSSDITNAEVVAIDGKYIDRYNTPTEGMLNGIGMNYDNLIYGDAMYETSNEVYRYNGSTWLGNPAGSWYMDDSCMPFTTAPFLRRGGYWNYGSTAGVFFFGYSDGSVITYVSFRPVLFVK